MRSLQIAPLLRASISISTATFIRLTRATFIYNFHPSQCRELLNNLLNLASNCFSKSGHFRGMKPIFRSYLLLAFVSKEK